mmetsp:Transcript_39519/g.60329  ORF Transcript_39519/g.60329 Transcript_39519/m.60329 type:complete len:82 (-) Transcript_39519:662-907(-)|eukprot:CAMPEP_0170495838 /NCGR_PEP_ID=MMETSP0208-20121228/18892_1 /TAXON_ID=197538 /ORGANISM="Strombidium inclinatum, Strain S3" /LENGTH=81 /DNA_ID=CAMNT_0010772215 /DNA_START=743 /DNA_END=988 /DNA_ORIENTATION=+
MRKESSVRTKSQKQQDLHFLEDIFVRSEDLEIQLDPKVVHEYYAKYSSLEQCVEALVEFRNSLIDNEDEFEDEEMEGEDTF